MTNNPMKTTNPIAAHTPGPWSVNTKYADYVSASDGFSVATCNRGTGRSSAMAEANARLIASAPELEMHLRNLARSVTDAIACLASGGKDRSDAALGLLSSPEANAALLYVRAKGQP